MAFHTTEQAPRGAAFTTTTSGIFIPEIWSEDIRRFRDQKLILGRMVKRINFVGVKGDKIYIPKVGRLSVNTKVTETPVTLQARTDTEWFMTIDRYRESSFMVEDLLAIQAKYDVRREYTREAGYALARDIEYWLLGHRASVPAAQRVAAAGDLDRASILAGKLMLDQKEVPEEGRVLLVSAAQYISLLTISEFISADFVNNRPTVSGMVGTLFGMPVIMTTAITKNSATGLTFVDGGASAPTPGYSTGYYPTQTIGGEVPLSGVNYDNKYTAMLFHSDWLALAMQQMPKIESARETMYLADVVVNSTIYGAKVFREDHAVLITSAETA